MRWSAPKARRVLYVDGEMTLVDLQKRVAALKAGIGLNIRNDHFRLLAADHPTFPTWPQEPVNARSIPCSRMSTF